jgi:heme exporter protein CcmD
MSGKYALFIWGSYALTALILLWNILSPRITRSAVMRRLSDSVQPDGTDE